MPVLSACWSGPLDVEAPGGPLSQRSASAQIRVALGVIVAQRLVAGSAIHQRQAVATPEAFDVALRHLANRQARRRRTHLRGVAVRRV